MSCNLYLLVTVDGIFKVGHTNDLGARIRAVTDPDKVIREESYFLKSDESTVVRIEEFLKKLLSEYQVYNPYPGKNGFTEWFKLEVLDSCVKALTESLNLNQELNLHLGLPESKIRKKPTKKVKHKHKEFYGRFGKKYCLAQKRIFSRYVKFLPNINHPVAVKRKRTELGYEYHLFFEYEIELTKRLGKFDDYRKKFFCHDRNLCPVRFSSAGGISYQLYSLNRANMRRSVNENRKDFGHVKIISDYHATSTEDIIETSQIGFLRDECLIINEWLELMYKKYNRHHNVIDLLDENCSWFRENIDTILDANGFIDPLERLVLGGSPVSS